MRAGVKNAAPDAESCRGRTYRGRLQSSPAMAGRIFQAVTTQTAYTIAAEGQRRFGLPQLTLASGHDSQMMAERGIEVVVMP